jgi:hypothetical protein
MRGLAAVVGWFGTVDGSNADALCALLCWVLSCCFLRQYNLVHSCNFVVGDDCGAIAPRLDRSMWLGPIVGFGVVYAGSRRCCWIVPMVGSIVVLGAFVVHSCNFVVGDDCGAIAPRLDRSMWLGPMGVV